MDKEEIDDSNFETIIDKVSTKSGLTPANIRNLLVQNQDWDLAEYFKVKPKDIDCIFSNESSSEIAEFFGFTYAELQNLIDELGKNFVVGMLLGKLITENE